MLIDRIRKTRHPDRQEIDQVFTRLQSMREQIAGHRQVPVADIFGLARREDSRRANWPHVAEAASRKEPERVRPQDVPSSKNFVHWE